VRLKNTKQKGSRNERRSRDLYLAQGYYVVKAGASLGMWDLVCLGTDGVVLIQVKSNRMPPRQEMDVLRAFVAPSYCKKLVHVWRDFAREPDVTVLA
jgi:Holliday junction resolvase